MSVTPQQTVSADIAESSGRRRSTMRGRLGVGAVVLALALGLGPGVAEAQGNPTEAEIIGLNVGTHERVTAKATTTIDGVTEVHQLTFIVEKETNPGARLLVGPPAVANGPAPVPVPPVAPPPVPPAGPDNGDAAEGPTIDGY